ncbi:unnamed protein product [Danaus chrysippus]|uniref:(African queen) hypothetical protein n=1 Tax=Danaus chrysippus TaxID=151541 RepID=A0A8J2QNT0_9NEOP|nr:unnamed protein product [Danaus chrysippus]
MAVSPDRSATDARYRGSTGELSTLRKRGGGEPGGGDLVAIEGLNRARNERGGVWWWRAAGVTSQRAYTISMATSAALGGLAMVWGGH